MGARTELSIPTYNNHTNTLIRRGKYAFPPFLLNVFPAKKKTAQAELCKGESAQNKRWVQPTQIKHRDWAACKLNKWGRWVAIKALAHLPAADYVQMQWQRPCLVLPAHLCLYLFSVLEKVYREVGRCVCRSCSPLPLHLKFHRPLSTHLSRWL